MATERVLYSRVLTSSENIAVINTININDIQSTNKASLLYQEKKIEWTRWDTEEEWNGGRIEETILKKKVKIMASIIMIK